MEKQNKTKKKQNKKQNKSKCFLSNFDVIVYLKLNFNGLD